MQAYSLRWIGAGVWNSR